MELAVGQFHRNIDHREAQRPAHQKILHPMFDGGNILLRHDAAGDGIGELETGAARQRFDLDMHITELAVAARLLFVAGMLGYVLADRFLVGHLRQLRFNLQLVAVR